VWGWDEVTWCMLYKVGGDCVYCTAFGGSDTCLLQYSTILLNDQEVGANRPLVSHNVSSTQ
jgi:hypothetical protein